MKRIILALVGTGLFALMFGGTALAGSEAISAMANITMNLNHFPSDDDKATLEAIVDSEDSSEEEASIAMALINMQHKVTEKDAERLKDIVDDDASDESARKLAGIVLGINHAASEQDKAALATLASM